MRVSTFLNNVFENISFSSEKTYHCICKIKNIVKFKNVKYLVFNKSDVLDIIEKCKVLRKRAKPKNDF